MAKTAEVTSRTKSKNVRTMFSAPKYQYLAEIITITSPAAAQRSVSRLSAIYRGSATNEKKIRIARATNLAANRAKAFRYSLSVSDLEKKELVEITDIYQKAATKFFASVK